MPPTLNRYAAYSFLVHAVFLTWLGLLGLSSRSEKQYYAVDFVGGSSGAVAQAPAPQVQAEPAKPEPVKTVVNPKEDLLLKKKKKDKVPVKEVVSEAAPVPSAPVPKPLNVPSAKDSGDSSVIPRAPAGSGVGIGIGSGGSGSPGNFPYTWYVHAVRQKIDANWTVSSGFDQRIFTQVAFTINKDGSIVRTEIEQGSGNEVFDRAAVRAVEYCNPLPPLPQGYAESDLRVHVRFTVKR